MNASLSRPGTGAAVAFARDTRRMILPMLGAVIVTLYILAPFCWLLLTSFMHEQDALSVPPQWIPQNPTLSNYMTFIDPAGGLANCGCSVHLSCLVAACRAPPVRGQDRSPPDLSNPESVLNEPLCPIWRTGRSSGGSSCPPVTFRSDPISIN